MFCEKGVLRNFTKFTIKHRCQSLFFNKTLLKKRLYHRCFPVNFVKFLRTPFYIEHLWWLLLDRPTQAYKHIMIGPAMCCKQNYKITLLKGLITDNKNLLCYSSLQPVFSKTTAVGSIIALRSNKTTYFLGNP